MALWPGCASQGTVGIARVSWARGVTAAQAGPADQSMPPGAAQKAFGAAVARPVPVGLAVAGEAAAVAVLPTQPARPAAAAGGSRQAGAGRADAWLAIAACP